MKSSEIRDMGVNEIKAKCDELKKELFNMKIRHSTGQLEQPVKLRYVRKDIARLKTILVEKERGAKKA